MRLFWIVAVILGTSAGFGGGYLTATQFAHSARQDAARQELLKQTVVRQDAARQELLKQLVATKAGIETGLAVADLRNSEKQVRAALDLAANGLNDHQRPAAEEALHAISQTVAAWDETFTKCHSGGDGLALLELGDCDNKTFKRIFSDMAILSEFMRLTENYSIFSPPKRNALLRPLFSVSLDRIQTAINSLR